MVGSGPSGGTARGDFCQSWRGQAAARWNRRAAAPNAIRVSVINDRVDPVSGTALCPNAVVPLRCPKSAGDWGPPPTVLMDPLRAPALTCQTVIAPVGPVAKLKPGGKVAL